jgi:predicted GNAT superfamily acetyltransferase
MNEARAAAVAAAERSRVRIEPAHDLKTLEQVCRVVDEIWHPEPTNPPVTAAWLRALTHAGNYCTVAYDGADIIGVCLGFLAATPPNSMHSHIAGVVAAGAGRHIGFALKLDQRAWALEHGLTTITWTYDPLVRRNAFFNASKLGALPVEYVVDFYGAMDDSINLGQGSDRLVATWPLLAARTVAACAGRPDEPDVDALVAAGASIVLDDEDSHPLRLDRPQSDVALVRVPADIEALRLESPELAADWRRAVREELGGLMNSGWTVTGVSRQGWYVLERQSV